MEKSTSARNSVCATRPSQTWESPSRAVPAAAYVSAPLAGSEPAAVKRSISCSTRTRDTRRQRIVYPFLSRTCSPCRSVKYRFVALTSQFAPLSTSRVSFRPKRKGTNHTYPVSRKVPGAQNASSPSGRQAMMTRTGKTIPATASEVTSITCSPPLFPLHAFP